MMADPQALRLDAVGKEYVQGENRLTILDRAELTLAPGEMVALVAPSGAGKSTLLHIAGLLDRPDSGEVYIGGVACGTLGDEKRTAMRRQAIGFVYQFHHLLPEFSALENVMLPQMIGGLSQKGAATRAQELLDYMRIGARSQHWPADCLFDVPNGLLPGPDESIRHDNRHGGKATPCMVYWWPGLAIHR